MIKRSNTALLVDDNCVALVLSSKLVQSVVADLKVVTFNSAKDVIEYLKKAEEIPSVIFSDLNMEGINGQDLLSWCKRHPTFHSLPFIFLSGEACHDEISKLGALDYCLKPLQSDAVSNAYEKAKKKFMLFDSDEDMSSSFCEEALELCSRMNEILQTNLDQKEVNEIYRIFHTIKGVAASLDFTYLSSQVHKAENFLTLVKDKNTYSHPKVKSILIDFHHFLHQSFECLKNNLIMPETSNELMKSMLEINSEFVSGYYNTPDSQNGSPKTISNNNEQLTTSKSDTIRVKHKELDDIQLQLKKILQIKVQLNYFGRQLHEEFFDESFPKELIKMVTSLEQSSLIALESLIQLRVQSVDLLTPYCNKLIKELCEKLEKKCQIEFTKTGNIDVDLPIIELLKAGFTHVLRNAMDHGIESPSERVSAHKPEGGKITVHYEKLPDKTFKVQIKDDGRGINKDKLKKILISKNILSEEQVNDLNDHQINQMIFLDGLSTKSEVSDISGRGVGISAVKADIEKMGGSLVVESLEGSGTTFTIILPLYFVL